MKPFLLLICFVSFFTSFSIAQGNEIETIKKLNHDWLNCYPTRDTATLSKILAADFLLVNPDGSKQNKQDNLLNVMNPNVETVSVSFDNVEVRIISPTTAILNAWARFVFKANGKQLTGKNCYQDVYIKKNNVWVAVAAHVTSLGTAE